MHAPTPRTPGWAGAWDAAERLICGLLASSAMLLATYQLITRYVAAELSQPWIDEIVIYLIVWASFVAASLLVEENGHVRADVLLQALPPHVQRKVELVNIAACAILCALLVWYGAAITIDALETGERSISGARFPMWAYYISLPIGSVLMTLRYVRRGVLLLRNPRSVALADSGAAHP